MNSQKKVVFLNISGYLSPIPRIHIMAEYLAKENYDVTVICIDKNMDSYLTEINGVKVVNIAFKMKHKSNGYKKLLESFMLMKEESFRIEPQPRFVQFFSPLLIPVSLLLKSRTKCKLIYDCYEYWVGAALVEKKYLSCIFYILNELLGAIFIDGVIYVYEKNPTRKLFQLIKNKILRKNIFDCVIYNIPDNKNLPPEISKKLLKKEIFGDENCLVIGYLGLVMPFKGYENAIRCMTFLDENYKLLLIGDAIDSNFKERICNLIDEYNLRSRVIFTGIVSYSEALKYTKCCDAGLLLFEDTSWTKYSTPNKLFEYMALGVPIVANEIPNILYFVSKYSCGFTVPNNDPKVIAKVIIKICTDPDLQKKCGNNGRVAFAQNFTKDIQMKNLVSLYTEI